jgi:SAM-dependent methyltransferase
MPGARGDGEFAIGRGLLPSAEEWAVRNRVLAATLGELMNAHARRTTSRALDVGCQWGRLLDTLAPLTEFRWWGADPVISAHISPGGHPLVNGIADDLPFPDQVFDCVVLANVYEHIDPARRDASLAELHRVLVPNGILVGQLPNPLFPIESHSRLPLMGWLPRRLQNAYWRLSPARRGAGFHSVTVRDLKRRADRAGFEVVATRRFSYPPEAAPPSVRWMAKLLQARWMPPWSWQFVFRRR